MKPQFIHERFENSTVNKYIRTIRNEAKKAYAAAFWAWLQNEQIGPEPFRADLSYMAAQAVRINMYAFAKVTQ